MGYTMLRNQADTRSRMKADWEKAALTFVRESCENLRFDGQKAEEEKRAGFLGRSLREKEIPYNMQMDIDRLCLEKALGRFLESGRREDALDIYLCYLEMFPGDREKTEEMLGMLPEDGDGVQENAPVKENDCLYRAYVFARGLARYETDSAWRESYRDSCGHVDECLAAYHFLEGWGLASLFRNVKYPFGGLLGQIENSVGEIAVSQDKMIYRSFLGLYRFAVALNGRWDSDAWKEAKENEEESGFLMNPDRREDFADAFRKLSLEYRLSNINQAKAFVGHMREIGCICTDKPMELEAVKKFTEEDLLRIGLAEHRRWLQERYDMGWEYGVPEAAERDFVRKHKDLIPGLDYTGQHLTDEQVKANYERLDKAEQDKDTEPMECMLAMLEVFGEIRIYRLDGRINSPVISGKKDGFVSSWV